MGPEINTPILMNKNVNLEGLVDIKKIENIFSHQGHFD